MEPVAAQNATTTTFRRDFGKHRGMRLSDLPSEFVDWILHVRAYEGRQDLRSALEAAGHRTRVRGAEIDHHLWITPTHAQHYFGMTSHHMQRATLHDNGNWFLVDVIDRVGELATMEEFELINKRSRFLGAVRRAHNLD